MASISSDLLSEWDYAQNLKEPKDLTSTSHYEAYWRCPNGHSYRMRVEWRSRGCNCYYCSGKRPIKNETDLATLAPHLMPEWDFFRNTLRPDEVTLYSAKVAWWLCAHGHSWAMRIDVRTNQGQGCPYCSGQRVILGETDLPTTHPSIAVQWHPTKNSKRADEVSAGSGYRAWWQCDIDPSHIWQTSVLNRKQGRGCSICAKQGHSLIEKEIFKQLADMSQITSLSAKPLDIAWKTQKKLRADMHGMFNDTKFALEYDGWYFHSGKEEHDSLKTHALLDAGYVVLRIRESNRSDKLGFLDVVHTNLIQIEHNYFKNGRNVEETVLACVSSLSLADNLLKAI